jgi:hypothetical protein
MFFERFDLLTSAMSVIFGSATVFAVITVYKSLAVVVAAIVSVFSAVDLVVGAGKAARLHEDLAKRFISLERSLILHKDEVSDQDVKRFSAERLEIEVDEPPIFRVLDSLCHNELLEAMGYSRKQFLKIAWYQRLFAQLIDICPDSISSPAQE